MAERVTTVKPSEDGAPPQADSHTILRPGGEALCGADLALNGPVPDGVFLAECPACVTALDLYRAVLGTEAAL